MDQTTTYTDAMSERQARYARVRDRLAELEAIMNAGGTPELHGRQLREAVHQELERLPKREKAAWLERNEATLKSTYRGLRRRRS